MLCVTVEVEPRIVKQCRYHYCCVYKNYRGRVMEDEKRFCIISQLTRKGCKCVGKKFGGHPIAFMPDSLRLQAFRNAFKVGTVNFANSLSLPSIVKKYAPEVKTAKGLKLCWVKVKGVNNLT